MRKRLRFSIRALLGTMALVALVLGGWVAYSHHKLHKLTELREDGAIVIIRDGTPEVLQSIGLKKLSPFCSVPTVELYVTPLGTDALVGNTDKPMSRKSAEEYIRGKAIEARNYGANDIQLILIDKFDTEWMKFAEDNRLAAIGDTKQRYMARLKANQETGANINP